MEGAMKMQQLLAERDSASPQEEIHWPKVWKSYLYQLQQGAPLPKPVSCSKEINNKPPQYGREYHGHITREEASRLLVQEGSYLVRESDGAEGFSTLSLRVVGALKHFKLYYDGRYYVGEKKFHALRELVADGLVALYLEAKAGDYIKLMCNAVNYEESPYMTLNSQKRKTLQEHNRLEKRPADRALQPNVSGQSVTNQRTDSQSCIESASEYMKSHTFQVHTFKGLSWCDFCGNFMWGIKSQGVRCEDCGFSAHRRCSEKVPDDCCPDLRNIRGVFGVDLTTLVKVHRTTWPFVVDKCIEEIERRGVDAEGLYRVSGAVEQTELLKLAFDRDGEQADIGSNVCDDINSIAGVLKLYFRLLPIPLVTFEAYPALMEAAKMETLPDILHGICEALALLPPAHYNTLKHLMEHLSRVAAKNSRNKMTAYNLSTVFAPTLMPIPEPQSHLVLPELKNESLVIELLIKDCAVIFGDGENTG